MTLDIAWHQMPEQPQGGLGRTLAGRGEAASESVSDEAGLARHEQTHWGADDLLGQALARQNMVRAWKRVEAREGQQGQCRRRRAHGAEYGRTSQDHVARHPRKFS
jgi:hypothetical protein